MNDKIAQYVRTIPDFPEKGIMFRDITTLLLNPEGFKMTIDDMSEALQGLDFDVIAGTESRGFIFGTPLAYNLHKPFALIRKRESFLQKLFHRNMILSMAPLLSRCIRTASNLDRRLYL